MGSELKISADNSGRRVDRVLRTLWPGVPLGAIMKAIRTGEVRLDGKKTRGEARLSEGQTLTVPWNDGRRECADTASVRPRRSLETLYRDCRVWIVNKPAGLLTQPDEKGGDSVITRALFELGWEREDYRPATVQRLDRNTSGALMIALTGEAQRALSELVRSRLVRKFYLAVAEGVTEQYGEIDLPLSKDQKKNIVRPDEGGQPALTRYRTLVSRCGESLVEAELVTGRPHQVRAHLSAIGHPIVGDAKYGGARGAARPLLHAWKLVFPKGADPAGPLAGKTVTAPIPQDMKKYKGDVESEM